MNCLEFNDLLFSYIDSEFEGSLELDDSRRKEFEEHIKTCPSCEKEYNAYQKMINDIHALPMEELPKGYCKKLNARLEDARLDIFKKKRSNLVKYVGIAASCVLVISAIYFAGNNFGGFSKDMNDMLARNENSSGYGTEEKSSLPPDMARDDAVPDALEMENKDDKDLALSHQKFGLTSLQAENKIIKSGSLEIEILDFDKFIEDLNGVIKDKNGYIEHSQTSVRHKTEYKEYRYANLKLRVPQEDFYDVVDYIDDESDVYNKYINEKDVTKDYYDKQNILTNLEVQESRLRELYDKAENVTEILALENEIRRVRTEIDAYSIDLRNIDDRVNMASIELTVTEIEGRSINIKASDDLWSRAKKGFIRTVNGIIDFVQNLVVWMISYILVIIPALILGIIIYRLIKKRIIKIR